MTRVMLRVILTGVLLVLLLILLAAYAVTPSWYGTLIAFLYGGMFASTWERAFEGPKALPAQYHARIQFLVLLAGLIIGGLTAWALL